MRSLLSIRKRLNEQLLKRVINNVYVHNQYLNDKEFLLGYLNLDAQVIISSLSLANSIHLIIKANGNG